MVLSCTCVVLRICNQLFCVHVLGEKNVPLTISKSPLLTCEVPLLLYLAHTKSRPLPPDSFGLDHDGAPDRPTVGSGYGRRGSISEVPLQCTIQDEVGGSFERP